MTPIVLDELDVPEMWQLIIWMSERSRDWVLIGGLMVASFDLEYGHPWRQTNDVDSLFDVRHARRGAIRDHVQELREIGFEFVTGRQGLGHRLARGELVIDILSTEHFPEDPLVSLNPRLETFQTRSAAYQGKRASRRPETDCVRLASQAENAGSIPVTRSPSSGCSSRSCSFSLAANHPTTKCSEA